jgi:hypothetical protein
VGGTRFELISLDNDEQFIKALLPTLLTEEGSSMTASELQPSKGERGLSSCVTGILLLQIYAFY